MLPIFNINLIGRNDARRRDRSERGFTLSFELNIEFINGHFGDLLVLSNLDNGMDPLYRSAVEKCRLALSKK